MKMTIAWAVHPMPRRFSPGWVPIPQAEALGHRVNFSSSVAPPTGHELLPCKCSGKRNASLRLSPALSGARPHPPPIHLALLFPYCLDAIVLVEWGIIR